MLILYSLGQVSGRWSRIVIYTGKLLVKRKERVRRKNKKRESRRPLNAGLREEERKRREKHC